MIKICRYSNYGFSPQYQSKIYDDICSIMHFKQCDLPLNFNDYMRKICLEQNSIDIKKLNKSFNLYGIHVFICDFLREDLISFELNHIKGERPLYAEALINPDVTAYALGEPYLKEETTLKKLHQQAHFCAYIPHANNWNLLQI